MIHKVKVDPKTYSLLKKSYKSFDIMEADRDYKIGDLIVYKEFDDFGYSGREVKKEITHKETVYEGLKEGYVILSIKTKIGRPSKESKKA